MPLTIGAFVYRLLVAVPPPGDKEAVLLGAPGRGRTGMTLRPTDFLTHDGFRRRAVCAFGVWNAPRPWQLLIAAVRPPPSTLYTCQNLVVRTGLARRCLGLHQGVRRL